MVSLSSITNDPKAKDVKTNSRRPRKNTTQVKSLVEENRKRAQVKQEHIEKAQEERLAKKDKELEGIQELTDKLMAENEKAVAKALKERQNKETPTPVTDKVETRGRKKVDKTPTWRRYYTMRRIPRAILDCFKDRLTYDPNLEGYTARIKSSELLEELKGQYPDITNTTINTSFYRLKDQGWFEDVASYSGPESDRWIEMDPSLVMTPSELRILKQDH